MNADSKLQITFLLLLMTSRQLNSQIFLSPPGKTIELVEAEILAYGCNNYAIVRDPNPSQGGSAGGAFSGGFGGPVVPSTYQIKPTDFTWLTPIFAKTDLGLEFLCGGTLFSRKLIITAAHCVQSYLSSNLIVFLGRKRIKEWARNAEGEAYDIDEVIVHGRYYSELDKSAGQEDALIVEGDIAVLVLKRAANLKRFNISVIELADMPREEYFNGTFVGWGKDEFDNRVKKLPKAGNVKIVSNEECITQDPKFEMLVTENVFCAGYQNGTAPCKGDSGGGLYVLDESIPQGWRQLGIIKTGTKLKASDDNCDRSRYTTYTDITQYKAWLLDLKEEHDTFYRDEIRQVERREDINETRKRQGYSNIDKVFKCKDLFGEAFAYYKLKSEIQEQQRTISTTPATIPTPPAPAELRRTSQTVTISSPNNLLTAILFNSNTYPDPYTCKYSYNYTYISNDIIDMSVRLTVGLHNSDVSSIDHY